MSIVCVRKTKDGFTMASDQQVTWGRNKFINVQKNDVHLSSIGKIFKLNGMVIGCAGDIAHISMLQIFSKNHTPKNMSCDDILEWFMEFKDWCNKKTGVEKKDINIHGLIIMIEKCFAFYDFMDAHEVIDFEAVGSGMWLAMGAMETGATAERAVQVAMKYDLFCGGDVCKLDIAVK